MSGDEASAVCANCGVPVSKRFCANCGYEADSPQDADADVEASDPESVEDPAVEEPNAPTEPLQQMVPVVPVEQPEPTIVQPAAAMAEGSQGPVDPASPTSGGGRKVLIAVAIVIAAVAGAGVAFALTSGGEDPADDVVASESTTTTTVATSTSTIPTTERSGSGASGPDVDDNDGSTMGSADSNQAGLRAVAAEFGTPTKLVTLGSGDRAFGAYEGTDSPGVVRTFESTEDGWIAQRMWTTSLPIHDLDTNDWTGEGNQDLHVHMAAASELVHAILTSDSGSNWDWAFFENGLESSEPTALVSGGLSNDGNGELSNSIRYCEPSCAEGGSTTWYFYWDGSVFTGHSGD